MQPDNFTNLQTASPSQRKIRLSREVAKDRHVSWTDYSKTRTEHSEKPSDHDPMDLTSPVWQEKFSQLRKKIEDE